jgi:arylsulfatase
VLTAEFQKTGDDPQTMSAVGTLKLFVDTEEVASGEVMTQPGMFGLSGSGASVGRGNGSSVSSTYHGTFPFSGGTVERVVIDVSGDHYVDHEKEVLAYLARD